MAELEILSNNSYVDITGLLAPDGLKVTRRSVEDRVETMDGTTHIGRRATKTDLECTFRTMTQTELNTLTGLISPVSITARYTNPLSASKATMTGHVADFPAVLRKRTAAGTVWFSGVQFVIEGL